MTGALLGGAPVQQAARLQMVIMFMIAAASALAAILVTVAALATIVDRQHRVRPERVDSRSHWVWRLRGKAWVWVITKVRKVVVRMKSVFGTKRGGEIGEGNAEGERNGLLG